MTQICAALALTDDPDLQQNDPAEWHRLRREGLGGSDVPKLCGAYDDPRDWATPGAVYRSKVEPQTEEARKLDNVAAAIGRALEDLLAKLYEETTGLRTEPAPMVCDPKRPWRRASVDRLVYPAQAKANACETCEDWTRWTPPFPPYQTDPEEHGDCACEGCGWKSSKSNAMLYCHSSNRTPIAVLELKRPVAFNRAWKEDDAPAFARMQGQWYADIFGLPRVDIFALVSDLTPRLWTYDADPELASLLTQEAGRFWNDHVLAEKPPLPAASERREWIGRRFPELLAGMRDATEDDAELADRLLRTNDRIALLKKRKAQLTDKLLISLEGAEGMRGDWGSFTNREQKGRVAWTDVAKDLSEEVAEYIADRRTPSEPPAPTASQTLDSYTEPHRAPAKRVPRFNPRRTT